LGEHGVFPLRDASEEGDQREVRGQRLRLEPRDDAPNITAVGWGVLIDRAGEEAVAEGAERDEGDPKLLETERSRLHHVSL
jgi:hypothetical protein